MLKNIKNQLIEKSRVLNGTGNYEKSLEILDGLLKIHFKVDSILKQIYELKITAMDALEMESEKTREDFAALFTQNLYIDDVI